MHRISQWIVRHALLVLLAGGAVTVFFAGQLPQLELDPSAESLMLEGDPARKHYERIKSVFGTDSIIAIALHRPDTVFRAPTLSKLQRLARELGQLDGVERVLSLATTDNFADSREGVKPGPLFTTVPTEAAALDDLRRKALANHTFVGNLVSADGRTAGLIVFVKVQGVDRTRLAERIDAALAVDEPLPPRLLHDVLLSPTLARTVWASVLPQVRQATGSLAEAVARTPEAMGRVARRLLGEYASLRRAVVREAPPVSRRRIADLVDQVEAVIKGHSTDPCEQVYQVGTPVMKVRGAQYQRQDLSRLLPCTIALVAVVLFIAFRRPAGVAIPLGTVVVSVVWTFGLMAMLAVPLTVITVIIGPLMIAVGNCYAMHVVAAYYQGAGSGRGPFELARDALESCFLPVLLAGLTTLVGFLSVTLSRLSSIREFGLFSAFGILSSLVVSLTIAPAVLRFLPLRRPEEPDTTRMRTRHAGFADVVLRMVGRFDTRHGAVIAAAGILFVIVAVVGCLFLKVDTNYIGFFRSDDPVRAHSRRIHEELAGAVPFSVVLDARQRREAQGADAEGDDEWRGPFTDPELLRFVLDLQTFISTLRVSDAPDAPLATDKAVSFADQVKLMYQSFQGDRTRALPATREEVEALLDFFYKRREAEKYISEDFTQASVYVRTALTSSQVLARLVEHIEAHARLHAPEGVRVTVTGENVLILRASDEIARGQVRSLAIAFAIIFTLMGILFTSAKAGILSIIPNAIPVVGTFGLMGWLGVSLNTGTSLVASVALGIAVDDTIHYMTGFNLEMRRLGDQARALFTTLYLRGRAIVFTSVALFFGFMVLTVSRFAPIASFGYLTAIAMVTALLADLLVLPVLLRRVELVTLWDLVVTRLPGDPSDWTGVLRGLSPAEARRVVLLANHRRAPRGTAVLVRGADRVGSGAVWADAGLGRTLYAVLDGRVELRAGPAHRVVATLDPGQIFGEAAPEYGVRPPDVVAVENTELLALDEHALRRLTRRYPRVAAKLLRNLVFLLADRLFHAATRLPTTVPDGTPPPPRHPPRSPFGGLSRVEELAIRLLADVRTFEADQPMARRGDAPRQLYLLTSGAAVVTTGPDADDVAIARLAPGDVVAELATEPELAHAAEVRTTQAVEALVITDELFDRLVSKRPRVAARWALNLARILARRLDETVDRLAKLGGPAS